MDKNNYLKKYFILILLSIIVVFNGCGKITGLENSKIVGLNQGTFDHSKLNLRFNYPSDIISNPIQLRTGVKLAFKGDLLSKINIYYGIKNNKFRIGESEIELNDYKKFKNESLAITTIKQIKIKDYQIEETFLNLTKSIEYMILINGKSDYYILKFYKPKESKVNLSYTKKIILKSFYIR